MTQRERQLLQWIEADPMISQEALAERAGITRSSVAVHISNLMKKGYIAGKGYVLRSGTYAVVAGGVNVDIGGRSFAPMVARDSNPGRVTTSLGGVGRNIAHNMSLLGVDVRFLTAFGDDLYAQRIAASCGELGIDISHALQVPRRHDLDVSVPQRYGRRHGAGRFGHGDLRKAAAGVLRRKPESAQPCAARRGGHKSAAGIAGISCKPLHRADFRRSCLHAQG